MTILRDLLPATVLPAAAAALGPLVLGRRTTPLPAVLGWSNALAAGMMLGAAYLVMTAGLDLSGLAAGGGALAGIALTWGAHALYGIGDRIGDGVGGAASAAGAPRPRQAGIVGTAAVHAAPEGLAIGAAWALDGGFGLFVTATLAVHNVWEGAVLTARLAPAGVPRPASALLAVAANATQVLLAAAAVLLVALVPAAQPWTLGAAFGALLYLCVGELLPDSYAAAGRTSIAVVVTVAAGVVALLGGRIR